MTTFASGFAHSCAISNSGKLYVWGDNKNCQLGHDSNQVSELSTPTNLKLNYLGNKYHAQSVACGSHFTMVVASSIKDLATPSDPLDEESKIIQILLRDKLQKDSSLSGLFGLPSPADPQDPQDPYHKIQLSREQLLDMLNKLLNQAENDQVMYFAQNKRSKTLANAADKIKPSTAQGLISISEVEDFALGYKQEAVRIFAFGMGHHSVFPFIKRAPQIGQEITESEEVIIVARPTVLKVPRWMRPIKAVSCGSSHIMALTDLGQIYSWGCGSYGALGFGTREDL